MSLATNISNLATRVATEAKALRTLINGNAADNSALMTTTKTNLVAAINELYGAIAGAGAVIDDSGTSGASVWSSSKTSTSIASAVSALVAAAPGTLDTLKELADALGNDPSFATTINAALGNRVRVDTAVQGLTGTQQSNARTNIGAGTSSLVIGTTSGTAADAATTTSALAGKAATTHTHTASQISDASTVGKNVLTAADAATARSAIGAGTSSLIIGTTTGTAPDAALTNTALAGKAATVHTHTASQISDATTVGKAVLTAVDAPTARTALGAGTSNVAIGTGSGQAADAALVGDTTTNFVTVFETGLV